MLTRITELRKLTRNNSSADFDTIIDHLMTIQNERKEEEAILLKEIESQEAVRLSIVKQLEENNMPIPAEFSSPITLASYKKPRRRRRTKKEMEKLKKEDSKNNVNS